VTKLFLKSLGVISRLVLMDDKINMIAAAPSPVEVAKIIEEADLDVAERLSSGDIARRVEPLRLGMNLKDAADLFFRNNTHTLPVLDDNNGVVGILRASDLVTAALPEYAKMIGDLHFLSEFEPFDRFLEQEDKMLVDAIMTKNYYSVDEAAPIIEVASILVHHMETALVVKSKGLYWGMVSLRDVITKVMRV
jgi:CBS domain-containing protein